VQQSSVVPGDRMGVIYFPVDWQRFSECRTRWLRDELGVSESATLFGNVARLSEMKGQDYFLHAAAKVLEEVEDACFVLVGEGKEEGRLRGLIKELGLQGKAFMAGFRQDIADVMNSIDVMVLSSIYGEALGGVTLEAMAAGKPVIVTGIGGLPELVDDGKNGLIVPPRDADALAEAMIELHKDHLRAEEMGRMGLQMVKERFSPERFWQAWNPLLSQAADLSGHAS